MIMSARGYIIPAQRGLKSFQAHIPNVNNTSLKAPYPDEIMMDIFLAISP
jgi:hypothetical protein